ncbi:MAG: hypothetical protein C5B49_16530 [Bdellovibrio sp.]|nr:MAG: hypothetical protein C5B49_16530 [Bdellovibrio sp.]
MPIELSETFWESCWARQNGAGSKLKAAILAAGLGKRMDPLTVSHLPKPLFPLCGKIPMSEVWVRRFVESGITDISMNLCVLSKTLKRHFGDGSKFAAQITFVDEEIPTGTLGGVCKQGLGSAAKRLSHDPPLQLSPFGGDTIIVPSGDIVTNFGAELLEQVYHFHKKVGSAFTIVLVPVPWERRGDFGTVVMDSHEKREGLLSAAGPIKEFREKDPDSPSNLNNASIYIIEMDLLRILDSYRTTADPALVEPFYDFGKHVFPALLGKLPYVSLPKGYSLWGIQYDGEWYDVGQKRDYLRVNNALLDGKLDLSVPYEKFPWGYLGNNTNVDFSRISVTPPVLIGNNCVIEPGARLGPYAVIGDDWIIGREALIRDSVLWQRYSYFTKDGREIRANERRLVDRHEIRSKVTVEECIVVGGSIQNNIKEQTVDILEDGELSMLSIDHVPRGPRA